MTHFVDRWERDEVMVVLLWSSTTNADAAQRMQAIFATQLLPVIAGINPEDPLRRAGLIATQMLGLSLCRYVLKLPPIVAMRATRSCPGSGLPFSAISRHRNNRR